MSDILVYHFKIDPDKDELTEFVKAEDYRVIQSMLLIAARRLALSSKDLTVPTISSVLETLKRTSQLEARRSF